MCHHGKTCPTRDQCATSTCSDARTAALARLCAWSTTLVGYFVNNDCAGSEYVPRCRTAIVTAEGPHTVLERINSWMNRFASCLHQDSYFLCYSGTTAMQDNFERHRITRSITRGDSKYHPARAAKSWIIRISKMAWGWSGEHGIGQGLRSTAIYHQRDKHE